ncbi:hypothetical protein FRB99_002800 [Tulasnella sp. 403]|nr:hypothetical protein FRB99_002800 [Tulasnella sp. 403]
MSPLKPPATLEICNLTDSTIRVNRGGSNLAVNSLNTVSHIASQKLFAANNITISDSVPDGGNAFSLKLLKSAPKAGWKQLKLQLAGAKKGENVPPAQVPFRAFAFLPSKDTQRLLVLPTRNMASFLRDIPDHVHLSNILLPGTHESMALYGWPFAACQNSSQGLLQQLQDGIRVLDVRLAIVNGNALVSYHGPISQRTPFSDVLAAVYAFLRSDDGKDECVVMSIKQEDYETDSPVLFSTLVHDAIYNSNFDGTAEVHGVAKVTTANQPLPPAAENGTVRAKSGLDMWFLQDHVPTLGEARGKIILLSRFGDGTGWEGGLNGMGIYPTTWPNSVPTGFTWDLGDTTFQMQDWYDIKSIGKATQKFQVATSTLIVYPSTTDPTSSSHHVLPFSFSSASSIPLALPVAVALGVGIGPIGFKGVNPMISSWALNILTTSDPAYKSVAAVTGASKSGGTSSEEKTAGTGDVKAAEQAPPKLQRVSGWLMMDFYDEPAGIIPLLVEMNFMNQKLGVQ